MRRVYLLVISMALVSLLGLAACSPSEEQPQPGTPGGMMGPGMMGPGMMGGWGSYNPQAEPITIDEAAEAVERYLRAYGQDLALAEVMEFAWNFYAEVEEETTGIHAMELLIDKYTGQVYPEMGPNMMWNTKYSPMAGMMGSQNTATAEMPVTTEQAKAPGPAISGCQSAWGYHR